MRTPFRLAAVLAVVLVTTSACGESADAPDAGTTSAGTASPSASVPSDPGGGTASPSPSTGAGAALPDDIRERPAVAAAIADVASRQQVTPDEVVVAAWTPVTWTDGSLGCPQKGMSYTQALVEGTLLILRVERGLFQYHARADGPFTYCPTPSAGYSVGG